MENAVDALKIAFGVMMFVLALTLSISSFSKANSAVTAIVRMNDRETEYTYIEPSNENVVGVETIIPTMYRAYYENIEIKFFDADGNPLCLYYKKNTDGSLTAINCIDMKINSDEQLLDSLLDGVVNTDKYEIPNEMRVGGLYNYLINHSFIEVFGQYYQNDAEKSKVKTMVITYKLKS